MTTLSLVPTVGLIGFVVDVGWMQFQKQSCLSAAISGAMAGARAAQNASQFVCDSGVPCQGATACPASLTTPTDPIQASCLYIQQNGFTNGGNKTVKIDANVVSPPVAGVTPSYWIRATVSQTLPLTFLSILNQQFATVSAEAT